MEPNKLVKHALDSTISLINSGSNPTEALEKVARKLGLNPNFIQRAGEATNVALHYNHFKKASDRSTDFPIADITGVTKSIFGDTTKTVDKKAEWFPSVTEHVNFNKLLTDEGFNKVASAIENTVASTPHSPQALNHQFEKSAKYMHRLDKEVDVIKTEKVANSIYLEGVFNSLVTDFKKTAAARDSFHAFETAAYSKHGDRAVPYLNLIYKAAGLTEERGAHDKFKFASEVDTKMAVKFASLLASVDQEIKLASELKEAEEYVATIKESYKEACHSLAPGYSKITKESCAQLDADITEITKVAGPMSKSVIEHFVEKYRSGGDAKKNTFSNTSGDNLERTTMLQELIMTDPILAHQDPKKILTAYQQILRIAPQLAKEKEVVRSLLRQLTATQSLAPVEANQLVEANTALLKQHQLFHSQSGDEGKKK